MRAPPELLKRTVVLQDVVVADGNLVLDESAEIVSNRCDIVGREDSGQMGPIRDIGVIHIGALLEWINASIIESIHPATGRTLDASNNAPKNMRSYDQCDGKGGVILSMNMRDAKSAVTGAADCRRMLPTKSPR